MKGTKESVNLEDRTIKLSNINNRKNTDWKNKENIRSCGL